MVEHGGGGPGRKTSAQPPPISHRASLVREPIWNSRARPRYGPDRIMTGSHRANALVCPTLPIVLAHPHQFTSQFQSRGGLKVRAHPGSVRSNGRGHPREKHVAAERACSPGLARCNSKAVPDTNRVIIRPDPKGTFRHTHVPLRDKARNEREGRLACLLRWACAVLHAECLHPEHHGRGGVPGGRACA